jgi:N-acetylmuramoyl-L-alanine amidase
MRWTEGRLRAGAKPAGGEGREERRQRTRRRRAAEVARRYGTAAAFIFLCAIFLSGAGPEKHLSVYSVAADYSVSIVAYEGRDYVGLLDVMEPLGRVTAKADGPRWRLRYNSSVEGDFVVGKNHARVQGREADLQGKFLLRNDRGFVPLSALGSLLPRFLGGPVTLHEESERLFIGSVGTHFTARLAAQEPPRLVFNFTAPVNPMIATEAGALRMTFMHEPVVAPASPTLTFGSKAIPSANYSESDGAAVVTVNTTVPVMASFSNNGRTITVATVAAPSAPAQSATQSAPAAPTPPAASAPANSNAAPVQRRYFAVVDASHGGDDHGETLSSTLLEKDVTLMLARSLRQELESRGITTLVLRDSDANLSLDQRAIDANADHAAIYIALHAASSGQGVRVYTALLPYGQEDDGPFLSWTTAQRGARPLSQTAVSAVAAELQKRQIPVRTLAAPLRPLNNITGPAIAVEVAPQGADVAQLTAPDYQQLITSAIATAIAANRDQLGAAQGSGSRAGPGSGQGSGQGPGQGAVQ